MDLEDHSTLRGRIQILISRVKWSQVAWVLGICIFVGFLALVYQSFDPPEENEPLLLNPGMKSGSPGIQNLKLKSSTEQFVLIDTDAGIDDAWAIFLCLRAHQDPAVPLTIVGITASHGNTGIDNVTRNIGHVLEAANAENIPVFRGSESSILYPLKLEYNPFVGADGFGDSNLPPVSNSFSVQEEHAVPAIARLTEEYAKKGQPLSILALAPLTNLAMALKMSPTIAENLREVIILGGNLPGDKMLRPEFNFEADAEAAYILFQNIHPTRTRVVPWASLRSGPQPDCAFRKETLGKIQSDVMQLLNLAEDFILQNCNQTWFASDSLPAAILVEPAVWKKGIQAPATVELKEGGRGMVVPGNKNQDTSFLTALDLQLYEQILVWAAGGPYYKKRVTV